MRRGRQGGAAIYGFIDNILLKFVNEGSSEESIVA